MQTHSAATEGGAPTSKRPAKSSQERLPLRRPNAREGIGAQQRPGKARLPRIRTDTTLTHSTVRAPGGRVAFARIIFAGLRTGPRRLFLAFWTGGRAAAHYKSVTTAAKPRPIVSKYSQKPTESSSPFDNYTLPNRDGERQSPEGTTRRLAVWRAAQVTKGLGQSSTPRSTWATKHQAKAASIRPRNTPIAVAASRRRYHQQQLCC